MDMDMPVTAAQLHSFISLHFLALLYNFVTEHTAIQCSLSILDPCFSLSLSLSLAVTKAAWVSFDRR